MTMARIRIGSDRVTPAVEDLVDVMIQDDADQTKQVQLNLESLTAATTREITVQDVDGKLVVDGSSAGAKNGATVAGAVTLGGTGTFIDTWAGGIALGTATATTGATLAGTEANIMPEVDVAAATAKVAVVDAVSAATALTESGARWLDGTATAVDMYLNLVVRSE